VHDERVAVGADDGLEERGNEAHSGAFTPLPIVTDGRPEPHRRCLGSAEGNH
jgi:hypothetical protein